MNTPQIFYAFTLVMDFQFRKQEKIIWNEIWWVWRMLHLNKSELLDKLSRVLKWIVIMNLPPTYEPHIWLFIMQDF